MRPPAASRQQPPGRRQTEAVACARATGGRFRLLAQGFSLVEVVLAIGVVSFALLSIMALLPLGLKTNRISAEESRAANILTAVEGDLRNSSAGTGTSLIYELPTPYKATAGPPAGVVFNTPAANTVFTKGLGEDEVPTTAAPGVRYQVSVIYTKLPAAGSLSPMEARLIVNWPSLAASSAATNLTDLSKVTGYVESYVTFPAP